MHHLYFWRRIPLWMQGILLNSLPLIAVLATATFAFFSNQQREKAEMSLGRHFEMVENLVDVQTTLLAAEAAVRARLLTHRADFLAPYTAARDSVPAALTHIRALMDTIPKAHRRLERIAAFNSLQELIGARMEALSALNDTADLPLSGEPSVTESVSRNEPLMIDAVKRLSDLRTGEQRILAKRLEEIRLVRRRDYSLIFLSVLLGLGTRAIAMYFFHRRVVRRVRLLTENARRLRDESQPAFHAPESADDIEELERELARIGNFLAERRISS